MNVGSLFSGIGGIDLGFEREGFTTVWMIENNAYCQEVLKKNFPKARIYDDITTTNWQEYQNPTHDGFGKCGCSDVCPSYCQKNQRSNSY